MVREMEKEGQQKDKRVEEKIIKIGKGSLQTSPWSIWKLRGGSEVANYIWSYMRPF